MTSHIPALTLSPAFFESPYTALLVPLALGNAVAYLTRPDERLKALKALKQPPLTPPPWAYGPAWAALYVAMGYASHRAWSAGSMAGADMETVKLVEHGATLYTIQLGLNLAWMPLFFGLQRPVEASIDIVALVATTGYLAYVWNQVDSVASSLMVIYLLWLCFATYLSVGCGYLNGWTFKSIPKGNKDN